MEIDPDWNGIEHPMSAPDAQASEGAVGEVAAKLPDMTLRDWFAGQCDVSAYSPCAAFELANGKNPTIDELAEYIAEIRLIEADAMLRARLPAAAVAAVEGEGK